MPVDRKRLRRQLQKIRRARKAGKPFDRNLGRLTTQLERSVDLRRRRAENLPAVRFEQDLPILAKTEEIERALAEQQVIVVCGETGSGKSTQLPKICLAAGRGVDGLIGHTQPRRIAARSVSARIAEELGTTVGQEVGFKIRFTDETRPETYIKLMTDGVLLAETGHDRHLEQYDTIIIDEAHERSLNIDFLLGYLKRLLSRRPELRVIVTSATIDAERFAAHFGSPDRPAPIIEVSGRGYRVELRYRPPADENEEEPDSARAVADAADELLREGGGDMLVFLPTERDIRDVAKVLRGRSLGGRAPGSAEVLPLYARLSTAEQNRVFKTGGRQRIVLATNVAESSLTVPGIRYVIDTGTARVNRFAPRSKVQRLPIEPISQASADQRAGRCGRVGPGICVRLYEEDDYLSRDRYATPEIRRTNLAAVILQMLALELGAIEDFPFLDRPRRDAVREGYRTLFELGAVDERHRLTDIGRSLSRLPVDPRIGRMILAADQKGCLSDVLIIAAALEVQDPRERPAEKREAADEAHAQWRDRRSDFVSYLKLWDFYHQLKREMSRSALRRACRRHFLSHRRMREWQDVHRQLLDLVRESGLKPGPRNNSYEHIHQALLAGLLSGIAVRRGRHDYKAVAGEGFFLWPGSAPFGRKPKWVVAAELVETSRRYLRTAARIEPEWIVPLAEHLVERKYKAPHWSMKRGTVIAYERVSLFGLIVSRKRPVRYGTIAPAVSRDLFIRHGLVDGQIAQEFSFLEHNRRLLEEIASEAAKTRERRYLVDSAHLTAFYDSRLPEDVYDVPTLRKWLRRNRHKDPGALVIQRSDLLPESEEQRADPYGFPNQLDIEGQTLQVDYRFREGASDDGLTLNIPHELLGRVDDDQLGWLVPGLLEEKIVALIRQLPKPVRQKLVPAPDTAKQVAAHVRFGQGPFLPTIVDRLGEIAGERIEPQNLNATELPAHLRMNLRVVDAEGESVAEGRDLSERRSQLGISAASSRGEIYDPRWQRDGLTEWDFETLPEQVAVGRGTFSLTGYPALVDCGDAVSLRLLATRDEAAARTRGGVRRLFVLAHARELAAQVEWLPDFPRLLRQAQSLQLERPLKDALADVIADRALFSGSAIPRSCEEFKTLSETAAERIPLAVQDVVAVVPPLLETACEAKEIFAQRRGILPSSTVQDIEAQLAGLFQPGFLVDTPAPWLAQYPRFLKAIVMRLDKARGAAGRDAQFVDRLLPHLERYRQRHGQHQRRGIVDPELTHFRWMLEEYRVSLFAQELGTSLKVSPQRLDRQWEQVEW